MRPWITPALLALNAALLAVHVVRSLDLVPPALAESPASASEVVRAKLIELVSNDGAVIAQLYPGEDGGGQLRLRNGEGMVGVKLGATKDGSALILMDREAEPAVWLAADSAGTRVRLAEQGKSPRVLAP
jgi:hypothetical protein